MPLICRFTSTKKASYLCRYFTTGNAKDYLRKGKQMNNGWIKIHRKFIDWQWFGNSEAVHLFIYLTLKANHADKMWQGHDVKRGQLITSINHLSMATGISQRSVRTWLKKFANTGEIELKTTNKFTIVTVCKYECYQLTDEENDKQNVTPATNKRQTNDKQLTTNKNDKNYKKEEEDISFLRFWDLYGKKVDRQASERKWNKIDSELHELIFAHVADYVASTPQIQYRKNPETYLNNRSWENEIVMEAKPTDKKFKVETMWAFGVIKDEFETLAEAQEKIEWYKNRKDAVFNPKLL